MRFWIGTPSAILLGGTSRPYYLHTLTTKNIFHTFNLNIAVKQYLKKGWIGCALYLPAFPFKFKTYQSSFMLSVIEAINKKVTLHGIPFLKQKLINTCPYSFAHPSQTIKLILPSFTVF